jgi:hypothetical protein
MNKLNKKKLKNGTHCVLKILKIVRVASEKSQYNETTLVQDRKCDGENRK